MPDDPVSTQRLPRTDAVRHEDSGGKPLLSLSLDLDNLWSYQKTHGDPGWEALPSYLDVVAELSIEAFARHGLTLTVFVVGQDAALMRNREPLRAFAEAGHEIANHSFLHEPWLHLYSAEELRIELDRAESAIERATGRRPRGFRGPGFSLSESVVRELIRRDYLYDASTLPTFLGPLARAYYFWASKGLSGEERKKRKQLFGKFHDGLRPIRPYCWMAGSDNRRLLEIPVTTLPILRTPIHLSYLCYLAGYSTILARTYLKLAVGLCRTFGLEPSFLLHPLDFLGADRVQELAFFPGMQLSTTFKLRFFDEVMTCLKDFFEPITMEQHARAVLARAEGKPSP